MQLRCKYWAIFVWVYIWLSLGCMGGVLSKPYSNSACVNYEGQWLAMVSYFGIKLTYALCVYVCMWVVVLFEHVYNRDIAGYDSAGVHEQRRSKRVPHLTKTKVSSTDNINPICEIHKP